jgi:hypothetical protein
MRGPATPTRRAFVTALDLPSLRKGQTLKLDGDGIWSRLSARAMD